MLEDSDLELTANPGAGQAFTATAFGTRGYDLGVTGGVDAAVGESLQAAWQVTENFNTLTSAAIEVGCADDAAGTNFVSLATTGAVLLANLTTANSPMKRLGAVISPQAITKRWLVARLTVTGTNPTTGKVRVILHKGDHALPVNPGAL